MAASRTTTRLGRELLGLDETEKNEDLNFGGDLGQHDCLPIFWLASAGTGAFFSVSVCYFFYMSIDPIPSICTLQFGRNCLT